MTTKVGSSSSTSSTAKLVIVTFGDTLKGQSQQQTQYWTDMDLKHVFLLHVTGKIYHHYKSMAKI
jgi:hypothetical protein